MLYVHDVSVTIATSWKIYGRIIENMQKSSLPPFIYLIFFFISNFILCKNCTQNRNTHK